MFKLPEVFQSPSLSQSVCNNSIGLEHFDIPKGRKIPLILYSSLFLVTVTIIPFLIPFHGFVTNCLSSAIIFQDAQKIHKISLIPNDVLFRKGKRRGGIK